MSEMRGQKFLNGSVSAFLVFTVFVIVLVSLTFWRRNYFFILQHPVYKM